MAMNKKIVPDEREIKIIGMFLDGKTMAEIGTEFGITGERTRQILKRYGYKGKKTRKNERIKQIKKLAIKGFSLEEVANILSIRSDRLKKICTENGIEIKTKNQLKFKNIQIEIKKLAEKGYSRTKISKLLNVSQSYVSYILLNKYGFSKTKDRIDFNDVKMLHEKGFSVKDISEQLGVTYAHVHNTITKKFGLKINRKRRNKK